MTKNYTVRTFYKGKVTRFSTHGVRRFLTHLRTLAFKKGIKKCYLRVSYGSFVDVFGEKSTFYNDGEYTTRKDLFFAFDAFNE